MLSLLMAENRTLIETWDGYKFTLRAWYKQEEAWLTLNGQEVARGSVWDIERLYKDLRDSDQTMARHVAEPAPSDEEESH